MTNLILPTTTAWFMLTPATVVITLAHSQILFKKLFNTVLKSHRQKPWSVPMWCSARSDGDHAGNGLKYEDRTVRLKLLNQILLSNGGLLHNDRHQWAHIVGPENGPAIVHVTDWQTFLSPMLNPLPGIKGHHTESHITHRLGLLQHISGTGIIACHHDRQLYVANCYCIWWVSVDDDS